MACKLAIHVLSSCQRVSKPTVKKPAKFQTVVCICQFLCPRTTLQPGRYQVSNNKKVKRSSSSLFFQPIYTPTLSSNCNEGPHSAVACIIYMIHYILKRQKPISTESHSTHHTTLNPLAFSRLEKLLSIIIIKVVVKRIVCTLFHSHKESSRPEVCFQSLMCH